MATTVKVAESSLCYDREVKLPLYARSDTPAVWLVDLQNKQLRQFSQPAGTGYQRMETAETGDRLNPPNPADCAANLTGWL